MAINKFIGRRPIFAFGNSDGDHEMLLWTAAGSGARFMGLVHHTDFNNARFTHNGVTSRFFRRDGRYLVTTEGEDGKSTEFQIENVFGVDPLQQELIELPRGRLQALAVAWDPRRSAGSSTYPRRAHRRPRPAALDEPAAELELLLRRVPRDGPAPRLRRRDGHVRDHRASTSAARPATGRRRATSTGPRSSAWRAQRPRADPGAASTTPRGDTTPTAARSRPARAATRAARRSGRLRPPEPPAGRLPAALLTEGLYHADGQLSDEVYEYGSFLQSKMSAHGVRCSDCHDPHSQKLLRPDNPPARAATPPPAGAPARGRDASSGATTTRPSTTTTRRARPAALRRLPHARAHLHGARPAPRPRLPRAAPGPAAATGAPDACDRLPRRQERALGGRRDRALGNGLTDARNDTTASRSTRRVREARVRLDGLARARRRTKGPARGSCVRRRWTLLAALSEPARVGCVQREPGGSRSARAPRGGARPPGRDAPQATRVAALAPLLGDPVRAVRIEAARLHRARWPPRLGGPGRGRRSTPRSPNSRRCNAEQRSIARRRTDEPRQPRTSDRGDATRAEAAYRGALALRCALRARLRRTSPISTGAGPAA